jgi:hypothetical protein
MPVTSPSILPNLFMIQDFTWETDLNVMKSDLNRLRIPSLQLLPKDILIIGRTKPIWFTQKGIDKGCAEYRVLNEVDEPRIKDQVFRLMIMITEK